MSAMFVSLKGVSNDHKKVYRAYLKLVRSSNEVAGPNSGSRGISLQASVIKRQECW